MPFPIVYFNRISLFSLLPALLHGTTYAIPIDDVVNAVQPTCTTLGSGSTTCRVGINSLPTLGPSLDGGYQWISIEPTTIVDSGTVIATDDGVWTNTQTDYVSVVPIITTVSGSTITSTATEYFSFITETAAPASGGAIIAAVVIAPAVIPALQGVADGIKAGTDTAATVAAKIITDLGIAGFVVTESTAMTMGTVLIAMASSVVAIEVYKLHKLGPWIPSLSVKPPAAPKPTSVKTTAAKTTSSSSSIYETVSAIAFIPYPDWTELAPVGTPTGPLPTSFDFGPTSTSAGCELITTVYPSSLQKYASGTQRFCDCGTMQAGIQLATSGTSTTTICATGQPLPTGYTRIPTRNGTPYSVPIAPTLSTTYVPPPQPPTTTIPITTSFNPSSPACISCGGDMGASTCKSSDSQCLIDQCNEDKNCLACGRACSVYAGSWSSTESMGPKSTGCDYGWCGGPFCDPLCGPG